MLVKIRIAIALFFFAAVTLLFLDFTGTLHAYLGWCIKMQLGPAILAVNLVALICLAVITLFFGRIYCSVICPLGIFQDVILRLTKKKASFSYRKPRKKFIAVRYVLLALFVFALVLPKGNAIVVLLDPYSAFGRISSQILSPIYKYGNNLLANLAERIGSYAFYSVDIWLTSLGALIIAIATFAAVAVFAYKSGRGYCNGICPAGTFLGLLAKFSLLKPRIDLSKCKNCGLCAKKCKAACIDAAAKKIDYTRCVACFNCTAACKSGAISYAMPPKKNETESLSNSGLARRNLLSASAIAILGGAVKLQASDGGLVALANKKSTKRTVPIVPPGGRSFKNFHSHCIGCQLCVSVCPNQVLRPLKATKPVMHYDRGYCRPECVKCSEVCPTGAINKITREEKSATQIGYAVWESSLCIVNTDKVTCDSCTRHCIAAAITLIPQNPDDPASLKIPMIDTNRCIGCGACEQLCPVRPQSAIWVEGIEVHRTV